MLESGTTLIIHIGRAHLFAWCDHGLDKVIDRETHFGA